MTNAAANRRGEPTATAQVAAAQSGHRCSHGEHSERRGESHPPEQSLRSTATSRVSGGGGGEAGGGTPWTRRGGVSDPPRPGRDTAGHHTWRCRAEALVRKTSSPDLTVLVCL